MNFPMIFHLVKIFKTDMMKLRYLFFLVLLFPRIAWTQLPERPVPPRLVNDLAGILSGEQVQSLEDMLVDFDRRTSTQIAVVVVPSLQGYDAADFAFRIGETWGIGQKDKNNGVVVLIKPKSGEESGKVFIAVGYGLEGVIPDAVANRMIVDNEMIPRFRENDYYGGILKGTEVIMKLAEGEYSAAQYAQGAGSKPGGGAFVFIFLMVLFIIVSLFRKKSHNFHSTGSRNLPLWLLLAMMSSGKKHGSSWSDFSGGRGTFGGGSFGGGGGFGGFGGGSFGGGGAGGSW